MSLYENRGKLRTIRPSAYDDHDENGSTQMAQILNDLGYRKLRKSRKGSVKVRGILGDMEEIS